MTQTKIVLGVSISALFAVAFLAYTPISEALTPDNHERDNIVLTDIKLGAHERMIVLDNAGGLVFEGLGTTSTVEVTARLSDKKSTCSVEVINPPTLAWVVLLDKDSGPFPVSSADEVNVPVHADGLGVAAVSVYGGDEGCKLKKSDYINVSTISTTGN